MPIFSYAKSQAVPRMQAWLNNPWNSQQQSVDIHNSDAAAGPCITKKAFFSSGLKLQRDPSLRFAASAPASGARLPTFPSLKFRRDSSWYQSSAKVNSVTSQQSASSTKMLRGKSSVGSHVTGSTGVQGSKASSNSKLNPRRSL